jgi:hypothetical protein
MKKKISLFLSITTLTINLFSQTPNYIQPEGLVAWWPFNGNTLDESLNGNNGYEVNVTLSSDRFGQENKCYHFDEAGEYISVNNNESLSLDSSFSISLWFCSENTSAFNSFISKASCNNPNIQGYVCGLWDFYTAGSNSKLNFQAYPYMYDANPTLPQENGLIELNKWHHFVVTYDDNSNNLTYYLNNEFVESIELYFDIQQTDLELVIGNHLDFFYGACQNTFMIGKLDDIGIWNRVISNTEIENLYNSIEITSLVTNNNLNNLLSISPNPTTDVINVDLSGLNDYGSQKLRIMNLSGQIVYEENINQSKVVIDVKSLLSSGIYLLNTVDQNGIITSTNKFLVQ